MTNIVKSIYSSAHTENEIFSPSLQFEQEQKKPREKDGLTSTVIKKAYCVYENRKAHTLLTHTTISLLIFTKDQGDSQISRKLLLRRQPCRFG